MKKKILLIFTILIFGLIIVNQKTVYAESIYNDNQILISDAENDCETLLGTDYTNPDEPIYYVVLAFDIIKYVAIIILIVMSSVDFLQAVASHDEAAISEAVKKIGIRAAICVGIFVLPILLKFVLNLIQDTEICGIVN